MFCDKCGSKVGDNALYCPVCGNKIYRKEKSIRINVNTACFGQSLVSAIIIIFAFFQDWIRLLIEGFGEEFGLQAAYSISNIKNLADHLYVLYSSYGYSYDELLLMIIGMNVIYYSMYVVIIVEILFIITKMTDNEKYKILGILGSVITILITAICFFARIFVLVNLTDVRVLTITIFPFIAAAASMWQLVIIGHKDKSVHNKMR